MIVLEFIIAAIAIGGIVVYFTDKFGKELRIKPPGIVQMLDEHYDSTIEKHKTLLLMENSGEKSAAMLTDEAMQQYVDEAFIILKPDVDTLIGKINSKSLTDVNLEYKARYFKNLASLTEALMEKRRRTGEQLSERDEVKLYAALKEAMLADLKERALNWKIGNL
jgi:hypothetical protein